MIDHSACKYLYCLAGMPVECPMFDLAPGDSTEHPCDILIDCKFGSPTLVAVCSAHGEIAKSDHGGFVEREAQRHLDRENAAYLRIPRNTHGDYLTGYTVQEEP